MQRKNLIYWIATGLMSFGFVSAGLTYLGRSPEILKILAHLGYPAYFAAVLGTFKIAGGVTIAAPRLPRLKEWAYAGMVITLSTAVVSHLCAGDEMWRVLPPLGAMGLTLTSWALRPASRKL